jgi:hypothetical protein
MREQEPNDALKGIFDRYEAHTRREVAKEANQQLDRLSARQLVEEQLRAVVAPTLADFVARARLRGFEARVNDQLASPALTITFRISPPADRDTGRPVQPSEITFASGAGAMIVSSSVLRGKKSDPPTREEILAPEATEEWARARMTEFLRSALSVD